MKNKIDFSASMVCVLCLSLDNENFEIFKGEMHGQVVLPPRGNKGFGYDPIFVPKNQPIKNCKLTYGEIDPSFKNKNSHRNLAFDKLLKSILKT